MTENPEFCGERGSEPSHTKRLLYLTLVMVLIASGFGGSLVFNELKQSQETAFKQRAETIVQSLTQLGGYYITSFDWPLIEQLVQRTKDNPVVVFVQIEDFLSEQTFGDPPPKPRKNEKYYTEEQSSLCLRPGE